MRVHPEKGGKGEFRGGKANVKISKYANGKRNVIIR